jgi:hypothetical protein
MSHSAAMAEALTSQQRVALVLVLLVIGFGLAALIRAIITAFVVVVRPVVVLVRWLLLVLAFLLLFSAGRLPHLSSGPAPADPRGTPARPATPHRTAPPCASTTSGSPPAAAPNS